MAAELTNPQRGTTPAPSAARPTGADRQRATGERQPPPPLGATGPVCRLCASQVTGDSVRPGPEFGAVHRACFIAWDREQEALELEFGGIAYAPDPDPDLEVVESLPRAA